MDNFLEHAVYTSLISLIIPSFVLRLFPGYYLYIDTSTPVNYNKVAELLSVNYVVNSGQQCSVSERKTPKHDEIIIMVVMT